MTAQTFVENAGRPVTGNKSIQKRKLLLGEGQDEALFFTAMLKHLGKDDVQVLPYDGKQKLSSTLGVLMADPKWLDVEAILITRDADFPAERSLESAAHAAWKSVTAALRSRGLPVPNAHAEVHAGSDSSTGSALRVGIFILPDGVSDGMLEDLCLAAAVGDPVMPCLEEYFRCIEAKSGGLQRHVLPKARAHVYLASRPVPDKRVGEAAVAGYWPWGAPALAPLLSFVRSA